MTKVSVPEAEEFPIEFVATSEYVYWTPSVKPLTEIGDELPDAVIALPPPMGVAVTV